jgi:hypothetical protein
VDNVSMHQAIRLLFKGIIAYRPVEKYRGSVVQASPARARDSDLPIDFA